MKLIEKDAVVAEIERRRESNAKERYFGRLVEDNYFLSFIDSMQEEQEHFLKDAPAIDYEVPKIEAWLAREDVFFRKI